MMADAERELAGFIDKFDPKNQSLIRGCRAILRKRLPHAYELVYDNYNFFVIGYCSSERPSDCIVSIAASAKGVSLSFYRGADLIDETGILQGVGSQNRFVRLTTPEILERAEVDSLIGQAMRIGPTPCSNDQPARLIIRSVSSKQRPRR
jgi:hypothetical protein